MKKNRLGFLIISILIFSSKILGQPMPSFTEATPLSGSINSDLDEKAPLLSADGNILFFKRSGVVPDRKSSEEIWLGMRDHEENWNKVFKAPDKLNNSHQNTVVGVISSGVGLYILTRQSPGGKKYKLSISFLQDSTWSKLVNINKYKFSSLQGFYVHPSEKIIVMAVEAKDGYGKTDIYISFKDARGRWGKLVNLGPTVNSADAEISPFLSADGNRLYFASNGHIGYGDMDIYYCERLYGTWNVWSAPKNLGKKINSAHFDAYFSISESGEVFFVSDRTGESTNVFFSQILLPGIKQKGSIEQREAEGKKKLKIYPHKS